MVQQYFASKRSFCFIYLLERLIKYITKNTTRAIPITPVHIPALKIPPIAEQLLKLVIKIIITVAKEKDNLRMLFFLSDDMNCV